MILTAAEQAERYRLVKEHLACPVDGNEMRKTTVKEMLTIERKLQGDKRPVTSADGPLDDIAYVCEGVDPATLRPCGYAITAGEKEPETQPLDNETQPA